MPRARALPEIDLTWKAIDDCPDHDEVERRLASQLGRPLRDVDAALMAEATAERTETGYLLSLRTTFRDEHGTRTFRAKTCDEVTDAAVLVLALSLDEAEAKREETPTPDPSPPDPPPPAPNPDAPPEAAPAPERARFSLRASGILEGGAMPKVAVGVDIGVAMWFARSRFELAGLWLDPQFSERAPEGGRVQVGLWAARATYCHHFIGERNRLGGCLGAELGVMTAQGHELVEVERRNGLWGAGVVSLRLSTQLHERVALVLEPSLAVVVARRRLVSTGPQAERIATLHTPAPTSKRLTFGVELLF